LATSSNKERSSTTIKQQITVHWTTADPATAAAPKPLFNGRATAAAVAAANVQQPNGEFSIRPYASDEPDQ